MNFRILVYICFLYMMPSTVQAQYFSELVPFGPYSPNPLELHSTGENLYLVSVLSFTDEGSSTNLIKYDAITRNTVRTDFINTSVNYECIEVVNNSTYMLGQIQQGLDIEMQIIKMAEDDEIIWETFSNVSSELPYVYAGTYLNGHLYTGSADRINPDQTSSDYRWEATIHKFDTLGNELWRKNYGQEGNYNAINTVEPNQDGEHLMVSLTHNKPGAGDRSAWLMKLDQNGDEVWRYESAEEPSSGADRIRIAQLSDGRYIVLHTLYKGMDFDYTLNGWNPFPYQFHWINDNGFRVKEKLKVYPELDQLIYRNIKSGNGDYFFGYGSYRFHGPGSIRDTTYAHLTKFSNEGDTIWTRLYHHPDYAQPDTRMIMNDIVEDENGDITCLVNIDLVTEPNKIWLFKVGASGCPDGAVDCPERNIVYRNTTSTDMPDEKKSEISIYPNPHQESFTISSAAKIIDFNIYNIQGRLMHNIQPNTKVYRLETDNYRTGIYILEVTDENGKTSVSKVIKQ